MADSFLRAAAGRIARDDEAAQTRLADQERRIDERTRKDQAWASLDEILERRRVDGGGHGAALYHAARNLGLDAVRLTAELDGVAQLDAEFPESARETIDDESILLLGFLARVAATTGRAPRGKLLNGWLNTRRIPVRVLRFAVDDSPAGYYARVLAKLRAERERSQSREPQPLAVVLKDLGDLKGQRLRRNARELAYRQHPNKTDYKGMAETHNREFAELIEKGVLEPTDRHTFKRLAKSLRDKKKQR